MRAVVAIVALGLAAAVLGATGVAMLFGAGWMLLFLAGCCVSAALLLARGVIAGG